jgi:hypothetical protein
MDTRFRRYAFSEIAEEIRRHQDATSNGAVAKRPGDHALYRQLRQLEQAEHRYQLRGH